MLHWGTLKFAQQTLGFNYSTYFKISTFRIRRYFQDSRDSEATTIRSSGGCSSSASTTASVKSTPSFLPRTLFHSFFSVAFYEIYFLASFQHPFYHPYTNPSVNFAQTAGIFPIGFSSPWSTAAAASAGLNRPPMGAKDDFATLLPTRKKRSKVTDTRLSKMPFRTGSATPSRSSPVPASTNYFPPTMVGHPLYGTPTFGSEDRQDSPGNSDDMSENATYDGIMPQRSCAKNLMYISCKFSVLNWNWLVNRSRKWKVLCIYNFSSTLTPMHLRKAKLMFFYTRYPSSALLKSYFPDIRFNKNNTAQLVKWFSNFRLVFFSIVFICIWIVPELVWSSVET